LENEDDSHTLLDLRLGLVSILLLLVELTRGVCVRLCLAFFYRLWIRRWTARHPILALIVRERLKPRVNLLPEVVVHVLQILHGQGELRSGLAVIGLAARDQHLDVLIRIGCIRDPRQNVARGERTCRTVSGLLAEC